MRNLSWCVCSYINVKNRHKTYTHACTHTHSPKHTHTHSLKHKFISDDSSPAVLLLQQKLDLSHAHIHAHDTSCTALMASTWQRVAADVLLHAFDDEDSKAWKDVLDTTRIRIYMKEACRRQVRMCVYV